MAISFANAPGTLVSRLAALSVMLRTATTYQTSQLANLVSAVGQFSAEPDIQAVLGQQYPNVVQGVAAQIGGLAQGVAAQTASRVVYRDNPRFGQTLTTVNSYSSLLEIIRQARQQNQSVLQLTVTATASAFTGTGDGTMVVTALRPQDGLTQQNCFAERITVACSADSYSGQATAGTEPLLGSGVGAEGDLFAWDWPLGSNCSFALTAIDADGDNSLGNLLTDGQFDEWSSGDLSYWEVTGGSSQLSQQGSVTYDGAYCLQAATGGTITFYQEFNNSTIGTSGDLDTLTPYAVNLWLARGLNQLTSGTLTISLVDGSGTVIQDEAGNPNTVTIDLTQVTSSFLPYGGTFRTPSVLPTTRRVLFTITGADQTIYLDRCALGVMTQAYLNGPYAAVFSGKVPFETGDFAYLDVTNSRGAGGTLDTWQTFLYRMFPEMAQFEILFPYSATPTISDGIL